MRNMIKEICLFSFFIVLAGCAVTQQSANNTKLRSDFQATSDFYNEMVQVDAPNIAMLNLFFTNMPKGGDLHNHYTGTIYAETYLDWVKAKNWTIDSCTFKIHTEASEKTQCRSITVDELTNNTTLYRKLLTIWSNKDFQNHSHDQSPPDLNFFSTFVYFNPVSNKFMDVGINILKERAIEENVSYIETMLTSVGISSKQYFDSNTELDESLRAAKNQAEVDEILEKIDASYLRNKEFNAEIDEFVDKIEKIHQGIDTNDFMMRFQSYGVRTRNPLQVYTDLLAAYLATQKSDLIVGVNILAPENNQIALDDYTLHMHMYNYLWRKYPDVHRALHAGELTLGMVRPEDLLFHINEAIDIAKAERIGHGIDLPYERNSIELLGKMKDKVPVEINLTSNEFILGVKGNEHPYLIYSGYGVPIVISTDDSGVSRNNLTNEFVLLASRYKPSYEEIKEYVYNSIRYSFMSEKDKEKSLHTLDKKFTEFEKKISQLLGELH